MNSYESIFKEMGESARAASIVLQQLPEKRINEVLCAMADALVQHSEQNFNCQSHGYGFG